MIKRGFLRSSEGIFPLAPRVTVVGRTSSDFAIQNITVDPQHAVIEYLDGEDCFILKDLNSTHGTYVNECRIQNASVRLTNGDILKFGFSTGQYEFHSEDIVDDDFDMTATYSQIPLSQRPSWQPNMIQQPSTSSQMTTLPIINYAQPLQHRHTVSGHGSWAQLPRAPSSNPRLGRPISANGPNRRQITPTAPPGSSSSCSTYRRGSVSGPIKQFLPDQRPQPTEEENSLEMLNEIDRLRYIENQSQEKTRQIESLMQQNNELLNGRGKSMNEEVYHKIKELTDEVTRKCNEVDRLQRLVERLSETSNRQNSNTSNNESDLAILRKEMEKNRKDLQISNGLVTTLQKDLSNRDETVKKLNRDIEHLNHDLAEKDISISALMNKLTKLKETEEQIQNEETEKQDRERELISLKHKLKAAETCSQEKEEQIVPLTKMVEQLQHTEKVNTDIIRDLTKKLEESSELVADLQTSESLLRVDAQTSENKYDKFRSKILYVALSIPGFKAGNNILKDEELVEIMKDLVKSKVEHDLRICEKQKAIDVEIQKQRQMAEDTAAFSMKIKEVSDRLNSGERTSNKIEDVINVVKSLSLDEFLLSLKNVILENLKNEALFLSGLESCISDVGPELVNLSLSECFKRIIERCVDAVEIRQKTAKELSESLDTHDREIRKLKKEYDESVNSKILEAIEKENRRFEVERDLAIKEEQQKMEELSKHYDKKINKCEENIEKLNKVLVDKENTYQENINAMTEMSFRCEDLEKKLKEVSESKTLLEQSLCEQFDTLNQKWKIEIETYKEEITQHSITIGALNDKVVKLDKENKDLLNQVTKMRSDKKRKDTKKTTEIDDNNPAMACEINNFNATVANLERCVSALRYENVMLKNKNKENEDILKGVYMDLAGAEARLSDLKGELSESQKSEIDKLKIDIQKYEEESNALRLQLSKMSVIVDNLNIEIDDKKMENKNLTQQISEEKAKTEETRVKVKDLETNLAQEKENWIHRIDQIEQDGRLSTELATAGSQCRGDRHVQIIDAQKMALMELRQKIKTMDMTRLPTDLNGLFENAFNTMFNDTTKFTDPIQPNYTDYISQSKENPQMKSSIAQTNFDVSSKRRNSNGPEVTQQMLQLKKELAELRAKQALKEGAPHGLLSITDMISNRQLAKQSIQSSTEPHKLPLEEKSILKPNNESSELLHVNKQLQFDLNVAKANQIDLQQNFELSENSYFQLIKILLEALDFDQTKGVRTFDNLSYEAKEHLRMEREEICAMIVQKIRINKEMIQRKDELLQSYEKDLVKLKQAEDLTSKMQAQLEHIVQETRSKSEEVDLLRETLNRTKDLLNHEKRVSSAIKQNKHYVPSKSVSHPKPTPEIPKYHCPPDDIMEKEKQVEKKKNEKIKRKDYEIKSLKSELYNKEKELSQATNRLYTLETTMGIKSEEPVS